jgi:hypothetical protein
MSFAPSGFKVRRPKERFCGENIFNPRSDEVWSDEVREYEQQSQQRRGNQNDARPHADQRKIAMMRKCM